ncbi:hypothetical protein ACJIZ3_019823 [Penstemon smallii]|uniref:Uncharacterized protein n=1 Tax=Penstemon smallii TaxID=265156 RepID=A0ABD3T269_9LAMI
MNFLLGAQPSNAIKNLGTQNERLTAIVK